MLGAEELIPIFILIVLLFGANKLPELARSMGSAMGEFKKAQMESEQNLREFEKSIKEPTVVKSKIQETAEKLGIDIKGKTDDQLLDAIQKSTDKQNEVSQP
jgi:sec-independent protein translocase protein TatA